MININRKAANYIAIVTAFCCAICLTWWVGYSMSKPEETVIVLGKKYLYSHQWDSHDSIYLKVVDTVQPYQIKGNYVFFKSFIWSKLHVTGIFRDRIDYFKTYIREVDYKPEIR